jgi:hypothetical protein
MNFVVGDRGMKYIPSDADRRTTSETVDSTLAYTFNSTLHACFSRFWIASASAQNG